MFSRVFGCFCALGAILGARGALLGILGSILAALGTLVGALGALLAALGALLGLSKEVWRPHNMMTCPGFLALAVRLLWTVVLALAALQKG